MPNGPTHDLIAVLAVPPIAIGGYVLLSMQNIAPADAAIDSGVLTLTHIVCSYWMSPDLDLDSSIHRRWGPLRFLWQPYNVLVPHRSWFSHSGISALFRIGYLTLMISLVLFLLNKVLPGTLAWGQRTGLALLELAQTYPRETLLIAIGTVVADALHVIADLTTTAGKRFLHRLGFQSRRHHRRNAFAVEPSEGVSE